MGLTNGSVGLKAVDYGLVIKKQSPNDKVIALAGNPNVGKSTVFNELTGLKQHTGNWPGKTVTNAQGYCTYKNQGFVMVDIPGSYSLMAHSAEEEVARDFICFGNADAVVVVCDATCLERNLNLVLQTIEITDKVDVENIVEILSTVPVERKEKAEERAGGIFLDLISDGNQEERIVILCDYISYNNEYYYTKYDVIPSVEEIIEDEAKKNGLEYLFEDTSTGHQGKKKVK